MNSILHIRNVEDYTSYLGIHAQHPLVSVICFDELGEVRHSLNNYDIYGFFLHDEEMVELTMGIAQYHYTRNSLICVAPGNVGGKADDGTTIHLTGWALLFHPALLAGTHLEKTINGYGIYAHQSNEALAVDPYERNIMASIMRSIRYELDNFQGKQTLDIVVSYIGLLLNYCQQAFNRLHHTHPDQLTNDRLAQLYAILTNYYKKNLQHEQGLPSVSFCAEKMCLSPNYLGDLIKQATGDTALIYIHRFIIAKAKNMLINGMSVSETAYALGFEYPQHLSRMFKKIANLSPTEFVESLKGEEGRNVM